MISELWFITSHMVAFISNKNEKLFIDVFDA